MERAGHVVLLEQAGPRDVGWPVWQSSGLIEQPAAAPVGRARANISSGKRCRRLAKGSILDRAARVRVQPSQSTRECPFACDRRVHPRLRGEDRIGSRTVHIALHRGFPL